MILHIESDVSYLSDPRERSRTRGKYYLSSLATNPGKVLNLPPPKNIPIHTELIILKHVVASATESEFRGMFHNGKTSVPLSITLQELVSPQQPTPIKTENSVAERIVTSIV